mgnify:CR=1 FL=1
MKSLHFAILILLSAGVMNTLAAQEAEKTTDSGYHFTIKKQLPATPVRNQYRSSTCWSYSAISFLESELLRMGKDTFDLSEMFVVRNVYSDKAIAYIRWNGKHNFAGGGASHDVTDVLRKYGMVPEEAYTGNTIGETNPVHGEMDEVLKANVDAVLKNSNRKLSPVWHQGFQGLLDAYLGKYPEKFIYEGKEYTPKSFAASLGLNPDDYVEVTSFTHHPYYSSFIMEVPDNWNLGSVYNVPLDDMIRVIDQSLQNGYTVVWGADISEKGFSWRNGLAVVPDRNAPEVAGMERNKWEKMTDAEKDKLLFKFDKPMPEKNITVEMRQTEFDKYQTTNDHGMHITGTEEDQNGKKYYLVKNSWGTDGNPYNGYCYASEAFVKLKTISLMVHKNAIPSDIRIKLGIK